MVSRFPESDTERYYNEHDGVYRSFWDKDGGLHWGLFSSDQQSFTEACENLSRIMVTQASINEKSRVLDLGCGNGVTSIWLAEEVGCEVIGIDLSGVRIENAQAAASSSHALDRLSFAKMSAADLQLPDGQFTHVWSQATVYHVPDKRAVLMEVSRTVADDGVFVFDDLIKPKSDVTEETRQAVYDRLLFDTEFDFYSHQLALRDQGLDVVLATDISPHLATSYSRLAEMVPSGPEFGELRTAYPGMVKAVRQGELGWGMYVCRKNAHKQESTPPYSSFAPQGELKGRWANTFEMAARRLCILTGTWVAQVW